MSAAGPGCRPDFLDAVRTRLGAHGASDGSLGVAVEAAARDAGAVLGSSALRSVTRTVRDELFGAGRLQALLDDPDVTDVLVNGPRDVWVERAGRLSRADVDLGRRRRRAGARGPARGRGRAAARRRLARRRRAAAGRHPAARRAAARRGRVRADQPAGGPVAARSPSSSSSRPARSRPRSCPWSARSSRPGRTC